MASSLGTGKNVTKEGTHYAFQELTVQFSFTILQVTWVGDFSKNSRRELSMSPQNALETGIGMTGFAVAMVLLAIGFFFNLLCLGFII